MANGRRKANHRHGSRPGVPAPGWVWLVAGLAMGLAVAAGIYWQDHRATRAAAESSESSAAPAGGKAARGKAARPKATPPTAPADAPDRFQFYDMLPNFEVVVPEEDKAVKPGSNTPPMETPGIYVLQAGSFPDFPEADAVKARLALLGVVSQIQKVTLENKTYHRVRIGPIEDLGELNRLRLRLRQSHIDFLVIRVGE